jgi:hypothetical protein
MALMSCSHLVCSKQIFRVARFDSGADADFQKADAKMCALDRIGLRGSEM